MVQAIGAVLVLIGALAWHVAASDTEIHGVSDIWNDYLLTMQGKKLK